MLLGAISSENVAVILVAKSTSVAPLSGLRASTVGGVVSGGGAAVVESATIARLNGLHPLVVPMIPTRLDLLHRPLRVWDGDRELRGRAVVIAADDGPLPAVYRDWLAHDRYGNLLTEEDSTRTNVEGVFAAGREAAREALRWLGATEAATQPVAA